MAGRKQRSRIPDDRAADVLFLSHHVCCVCREPGKATQIHHLNENPADHRIENLAVLCLEDHHRTQIRGGFSRHLSAHEVRRYRDDWLARVEAKREATATRVVNNVTSHSADSGPESRLDDRAYLLRLPDLKASAYIIARPRWDSGETAAMNAATYDLIDELSSIWIELSKLYPENHFGDAGARFIADFVARRFRFHRDAYEPSGYGTGGSIVGQLVGGAVLGDIERLIEDTVEAIYFAFLDEDFDLPHWRERWRTAGGFDG